MTDSSAIEQAIKAIFTDEPNHLFQKVDISKISTSLSRPGFSVAVIGGKDECPVMDGSVIKETLKIIVTLVASNVASEEERRKAVLPLVRYCQTLLTGQTLGLDDIEPLRPTEWTDVTTRDDMDRALIFVEVYFETATEFSVRTGSEQQLVSLMHYFDDAAGENVESADVTLSQE
ncbi:MAG: hypothetical protein WCS18_05250 [Sphaerochaetaceae bacterium]